MEPHIQYARTSDGVSIAYWVMGDGPPLVYMPPLPSHAQLDWQRPDVRGLYEWLATRHRLVRIDPRNTGLSERAVEDVSIEARQLDVEAVVDRLHVDEFVFFGNGPSGNVAAAFAAGHPDRIRRLILVDATVQFPDVALPPAIQALVPLIDYDWETYTETLAGLVWGWSAGDETRKSAALLRDSQTWEDGKRWVAVASDVSSLLPRVTAPTLVVHHREAIATTIETGRRLAEQIPGARLVALEGRSVGSGRTDPRMMAAVDAFLAEDDDRLAHAGTARSASPSSPAAGVSGVRTILFTDIVGHTEMMQRLGDAKGRDVLREHERITRETLKKHDGAEIKTMGDGFMASFGSVTSALDCAVGLQRAFSNFQHQTSNIQIRVGLNAGEPIEEDGDLFGATVILASRIAAKAGAGEILIPEPVRHLLSGKNFIFSDRGEHAMKGFDDAVRLYEVKWQAD